MIRNTCYLLLRAKFLLTLNSFLFWENHKNCSIIINRRGKIYCNSIAGIINKRSLMYFFIFMATQTTHLRRKHNSKYTLYDTCIHYGSTCKHYDKFTSQLTHKTPFRTIMEAKYHLV